MYEWMDGCMHVIWIYNPGKINGTKAIKQKLKGPKDFDICFSVIFSYYNGNLISRKKTGH